MIVQSPIPRPGAAPSDLSETTDRDHRDSQDSRDSRDSQDSQDSQDHVDPRDVAQPREGDPFRQLFHRHANHVNSAQTHGIQARLRRRLFAGDRELD